MSALLDNDITLSPRPYVIELQGYLRALERAETGAVTVPQDGYYGPDTTEAVRRFQQNNGLPPNGRTDAATWEAVFHTYLALQAAAQPPAPVGSKGATPLTVGDRGDPVLFLNAMIGRIAQVYSNLPSAPSDNRYTTATADAIRGIQRWAELPVTGDTDTATWNTVTALYHTIPREALLE